MASSFQQVILFGRLGSDPELSYTAGGTAVVKVSLATDRSRKDNEGEWTSVTSWHRLKSFAGAAETIGKYAKKGEYLFVSGRLDYWQAEGSKGKVQVADVIIEHFVFGGGGSRSSDSGSDTPQTRRSSYPRSRGAAKSQEGHDGPSVPEPSDSFIDDDIPF